MSNAFDIRRLGQIFSGQQDSPLLKAYRGVSFGPTNTGSQAASTPDQAISNDQDPVMAALSRIGNGHATDAYRAHLAQLPNAADYAPSKWRRLGAALTAGAGSFGRQPQNAMNLGEQIRDAPLRGALESWQRKGVGLKAQADMEADDVNGKLDTVKQMREYLQKNIENKRADDAAEVNKKYREAQINNLEAGGWEKLYDQEGNTIYYNPKTGERRNLGPSDKTAEIGQRNRGLNQTDRSLGQGDERIKQGAAGVQQGWKRVEQAERGLGLQERSVATGEKNATTAATSATSLAENRGFLAPQTNDAATTIATRNIVTKYPQFKGWVNDQGMIRLPGEYSHGNFFGYGDEDVPDPKTTPNYQTFLDLVEAERQKVISAKRGK